MTIKWSKEDNQIAELELDMANYLTVEINSRPEQSLEVMLDLNIHINSRMSKFIDQIAEIKKVDRSLVRINMRTYAELDGSKKAFITVMD